ncbi:fumarylacetoacetate hydrolase family protein [Vogesella oryzae]|uniref:fumarylacetoacetate hydrolase family protein n=1 Tax=Vogesella oryzae TaxID=1735285 RepID=UPI001582DA10|nr:fumarylacetoacetate hydrolase family protein [Vogesella oryzae]
MNVELGGQPQRVNTVFCIGRNYAAHAAELGNAVEPEPLVFLKPNAALLPVGEPIRLPSYSSDVHYECELVVLIGEGGDDIAEADALRHVAGYGIGLDLTARDVQGEAKRRGLPWTKAKGFRGAACISSFVPATALDPAAANFTLHVNGELRQQGDSRLMLYPVATIISYLSRTYGLQAGDLIYTGTPEGVGPLQPGDQLQLALQHGPQAHWQVLA